MSSENEYAITDDEFVNAIPGTEDVNFFEVEDREGDAESEEYENTSMHVGWFVLIIFAVGVSVAGLLFYVLYRADKNKKELAKLNRVSSAPPTPSSTDSNMTDAVARGATAAATAGDRQAEIEEGCIVKTWMAHDDAHPSTEESKEDEESQVVSSDGGSQPKHDCPICRQEFQTGDQVVSSRAPQACHHTFHKTCMFNWLMYQNRCPVCNEEYLPVPPVLS